MSEHLSSRTFRLILGSAALVLIIGSTWLATHWAGRELRDDLLQRARMVAAAVDPQRVAALSGTEDDLTSSDYLRIKEQLTRIRLSNPQCRFLYIISRRSDGTIFIYVDSEPVNSKDHSPPGQTYDEAPRALHDVFTTGREVVTQYNDRWGAWISSFVPLPDRVTGSAQTVLGMDIAAADWTWNIALHAALPIALSTIAVMLGLLVTLRKRMQEKILSISITDELTGLINRRGFLFLAGQQLKLAERKKGGMVLFFADLDRLKSINDTLGHEEGDKALIEAATVLKESFRASDIVARLGGDEYAALAIDVTEASSEIFTARLQSLIDIGNNQANRRYRLSISVGCSYYDPENPSSIDELISHADQLMYRQKQNKMGLLPQGASL